MPIKGGDDVEQEGSAHEPAEKRSLLLPAVVPTFLL